MVPPAPPLGVRFRALISAWLDASRYESLGGLRYLLWPGVARLATTTRAPTRTRILDLLAC